MIIQLFKEGELRLEKNEVNIIGTLIDTPQIKKTKYGKSYTKFQISVADIRDTNYFTVLVFQQELAESLCRCVEAGDTVEVIGKLQSYAYCHKYSGELQQSTYILANTVHFSDEDMDEYLAEREALENIFLND